MFLVAAAGSIGTVGLLTLVAASITITTLVGTGVISDNNSATVAARVYDISNFSKV